MPITPITPHRPLYHDYQHPDLYRAGCTLRASFRTGSDPSPVETVLMMWIDRADAEIAASGDKSKQDDADK